MTRSRASDRRGGRSVQNPATLRPAIAWIGCLVLAIAAVAACGPSGPSGPTGSPVASGVPSPDGSGVALPTAWPGNAVLGMEALGIADGQIGAATTDLSRAISDEDLALLREAADGLSHVADDLLPNMEKIRLNPAMVPFADQYEAAITQMDDAATRLRDAIDAGDAPAITAATQDLLDGLAAYAALQGELASWIEQMPDQKRMLLQ